MKASEIRELLKLLDQPDIISFAGGIPDPALFPTDAFRDAFTAALTGDQSHAPRCNIRCPKATAPCATGSRARWPRSACPAPPTIS